MKLNKNLQIFVALAEREGIDVTVRKRYVTFLKTDEGKEPTKHRRAYYSCESPDCDWTYSEWPSFEKGGPHDEDCVFSMKRPAGREKWIHFPYLDPETAIGLVKWYEAHVEAKKGVGDVHSS